MGKSAVKSLFYGILVIMTCLLAVVTILAAFSGRFEPAGHPCMALLGLGLPLLLIACLLASAAWGVARKRWALIPVIAIACSWGYLSATFQIPWFHSEKETRHRLKVATYNVHNFGKEITGYSCKEIARLMREEGMDVLCLQEMGGNRNFPTDSIVRTFRQVWEYAYFPACDTARNLPIAVFSRYPIFGQRFIPHPGSYNSSMVCDLLVGTDTIRLLNNHLQTTSVSQNRNRWQQELSTHDRKREVEAMENAAGTLLGNFDKRTEQTQVIGDIVRQSPHPVILCGDLNSLPSSYTYHVLSRLLKDGFKEGGTGYMYTYRLAKRLLRIDYIFHSPELRCVSYRSPDWDLCSDHNPVLSELVW